MPRSHCRHTASSLSSLWSLFSPVIFPTTVISQLCDWVWNTAWHFTTRIVLGRGFKANFAGLTVIKGRKKTPNQNRAGKLFGICTFSGCNNNMFIKLQGCNSWNIKISLKMSQNHYWFKLSSDYNFSKFKSHPLRLLNRIWERPTILF